jgi:hypothetical protein
VYPAPLFLFVSSRWLLNRGKKPFRWGCDEISISEPMMFSSFCLLLWLLLPCFLLLLLWLLFFFMLMSTCYLFYIWFLLHCLSDLLVMIWSHAHAFSERKPVCGLDKTVIVGLEGWLHLSVISIAMGMDMEEGGSENMTGFHFLMDPWVVQYTLYCRGFVTTFCLSWVNHRSVNSFCHCFCHVSTLSCALES